MNFSKNVLTVVLVWAVSVWLLAPSAWANPDETEILTALQNRIERVAEQVGQSVVSIQVMGTAPQLTRGPNGRSPLDDLPPEFRRFFEDDFGSPDNDSRRRRFRIQPDPRRRQNEERQLVPRGLGSGIIISRDGYIVTNQHVVNEAEKVTVTLSNKRQFEAKVVGEDKRRDLAVLKIEAEDLPSAAFNGSAKLKRGMFVLAIGSPFGFGAEGQASVSFGIVSGTRRSLAMGTQDDRYYGKLIQTDAAVNPGNSGGALCDLDGKIVGINVAIASRSGGSQGVGFAIPIDELTLDIIERLKKGESVAYGFLGVAIRNPMAEESDVAGAPVGVGAFVLSVEPGSPADKAGLLAADLITSLNGRPLKDADDLVTEVGRTPPGKTIKLVLYRSGQKRTVEAKVVARPGTEVASAGGATPSPSGDSTDGFQWRGLTLRDLSDANRREAGLDETAKGVYIADVDSESGSYKAGVRSGMIIDQIGSTKIESLEAFQGIVKKLSGKVFVNIVGRGPMILPE
jgi:serine protease Do